MAFSGDSSTTPVSQPGSEDLEKQQTFWTWHIVHTYKARTSHRLKSSTFSSTLMYCFVGSSKWAINKYTASCLHRIEYG